MKRFILTILAAGLCSICALCAAETGYKYTVRTEMIPMRDGVRLYTEILEPVDAGGSTPIIMTRTPYGLHYGQQDPQKYLRGQMETYAKHGYIIVYQNVRGKMLSEGDFVNMRPGKGEAKDTYDTAEWLIRHCKSNGNIGVLGVSYPGFYAMMAGLSGHPAIKAVSPQAPTTDWFIGDDAHHNGAFFLADMYSFTTFFKDRKGPSSKSSRPVVNIDKDIYEYYKGRAFPELTADLGDSLTFWHEMMSHPNYDRYWKRMNASGRLKNVTPAVLVVAGLYDAEDCYGAFQTYRMLLKTSPETEAHLIAGPWSHGSWRDRIYQNLGEAWFGAESVPFYQDSLEYEFFAYYLEGQGEKPSPVMLLSSGETRRELMENKDINAEWKRLQQWPLSEAKPQDLWLSGKDSLVFDNPDVGIQSYVSDPENPVPYYSVANRWRDKNYMAGAQSFASEREDVLAFHGAVLSDTLHVSGPVDVQLELSVEGENPDADIVVKLIDVRPDGYRMLVRGDIMPLRFRDGYSHPKALKSGKTVTLNFRMCDIDHYFMPGHQLMVQIQSSWFPLAAMNPQTFLKNPYKAKPSDYQRVKINIHTGESKLTLPVL